MSDTRLPYRPLVAYPVIREWARDRGIPVGKRGRLPYEVIVAYYTTRNTK